MAKQKENPNFSLSTVPHAALYVALNARCSTKASRQVCAPVIMLPISCITVLLLFFVCVCSALSLHRTLSLPMSKTLKVKESTIGKHFTVPTAFDGRRDHDICLEFLLCYCAA